MNAAESRGSNDMLFNPQASGGERTQGHDGHDVHRQRAPHGWGQHIPITPYPISPR